MMGCNRDKSAQELPQPTETAANAATNQELAAVAKALARTLGTDAAARQQLKAEALKKADGDYDVLYQPFVATHADFGQHVATTMAAGSSDAPTMTELLSHTPTLNLSVPVNIEKWDAATYAPLVIFIPAGYNERTATRVKAYDQDGNEHWLDAQKAPDFPVVVVGRSERVTSVAAAAKQPTVGAAQSISPTGGSTTNLYPQGGTEISEGGEGGGGGGGYTPLGTTGTTATSCRTDRQIEYLREIWMKDVSKYESWFLGEPEIRLQIMSPLGTNGSSILDVMYTMSRGAIEDHWYCNTSLYFWNKATITNTVGYLWVEQDDTGDAIDVKLTLGYKTDKGLNASTEITYKIKNDDDQIAKIPMDFDFCPSEGYYTGGTSGDREFHWVLENRP
ncbi:hypothetical protein GCM10027422_11240 [Hymenobacter arcticus]